MDKKMWKNWKLWLGILAIIIVIGIGSIFILRNEMTAEETVSKFMYLIENKEYEKAKKLCSVQLEHLDLLSNIKPSKLSFNFSENKESASSVLLENELEVTSLNIDIKKTILGWKIKSYNVTIDLIKPRIIEERLNKNEDVSDVQFLYWAESEESTKEEIAKYAKSNGIVALLFSEEMKAQKYNKASELYNAITTESLTVEQMKNYDWSNYKVESNFEMIENLNGITIRLGEKKLYIIVAGKEIMSITEANF